MGTKRNIDELLDFIITGRGGEKDGRPTRHNNCAGLSNRGRILFNKNNNRRNQENEKKLITKRGKYYEE